MNLAQAQAAARAAIEKYHYKDVCTIIEYQDQRDERTKITGKVETPVLEDQPCKLSFETIKSAEQSETASGTAQITKLFLAPEIVVKPGSKILVTHEGRVTAYKDSGEAAVYPSHQEIMLKLFDGWA